MILDNLQTKYLAINFKDDIHQYVLDHWDEYVLFMAESQKGNKMSNKLKDWIKNGDLGNEFLLISIEQIEDKKEKAENVEAYRYICVCPKAKVPYAQVLIKIRGKRLINDYQSGVAVEVEGIEVYPQYKDEAIIMYAGAKGIKIKGSKATENEKQA